MRSRSCYGKTRKSSISQKASIIVVLIIAFISVISRHNVIKKVHAFDELQSKPKVEVPVDLKIVEMEQKSVDEGHQPWKLDPVYVAQVFVSLKISPGGIEGDYPIKYEELKIVKITEREAIVEVSGDMTPIRKVYLKRLIRQDSTGIWTIVGYDPVEKK